MFQMDPPHPTFGHLLPHGEGLDHHVELCRNKKAPEVYKLRGLCRFTGFILSY